MRQAAGFTGENPRQRCSLACGSQAANPVNQPVVSGRLKFIAKRNVWLTLHVFLLHFS